MARKFRPCSRPLSSDLSPYGERAERAGIWEETSSLVETHWNHSEEDGLFKGD